MSITLNWNDNSFNESGFVVERSTNGVTYQQYHTASGGITNYVDTNVTESNTYWYRIFAFNSAGTSSSSVTASLEYTSSATSSLIGNLVFDQNGSSPYDTVIASPSGYYTSSAYLGNYVSCSAINCPALTGISMENNFVLSGINVSGSVALEVLNIENNLTGTPAISVLDVSTNTALKRLHTGLTNISSLDVSTNTVLEVLRCFQSGITTLNVTNNPLLTEIDCYTNSISSLNISANTGLITLLAYENLLSTIDVSGHPNLDILDVSDNALPQAEIDGLLADMIANGHTPSGVAYIDISNYGGGTNAPPSAAGLADIATLQGNGWTVYY